MKVSATASESEDHVLALTSTPRFTTREVPMRTALVSIPVFALLSTVLAGASHAGVRWELEYQGGDSPRTTKVAIEGKRMRVEPPTGTGDASRVILYDATTGKVLMLDTASATYVELAAINARPAANAPPNSMEELDKFLTPEQRQRLQNASPEERRIIEAALRPPNGGSAAVPPATAPRAALTFERPGTRGTVSGRSCDVLRVSVGGQLIEEDCIVPWGAGSLTRDEVVMVGKLALVLDPTGRADPTRNPVPDFSKYPGFPLRRVIYDERGPVVIGASRFAQMYNVVKLERLTIPATTFEVPPNYARDTRSVPGVPSP